MLYVRRNASNKLFEKSCFSSVVFALLLHFLWLTTNYYLQKQCNFITKHLRRKKEMSHYLDLLNFISFIVLFLVTLKRLNKVVDMSQLVRGWSYLIKQLRTERDLPPVLPSKHSLWSQSNMKCVSVSETTSRCVLLQLLPLLPTPQTCDRSRDYTAT